VVSYATTEPERSRKFTVAEIISLANLIPHNKQVDDFLMNYAKANHDRLSPGDREKLADAANYNKTKDGILIGKFK
jgi:hypothetical protein